MSDYRNENEIVMYSLGRSCSHAIKNWIASMFKEPVYCFNNCPMGDPFRARIPYHRRVRGRPIGKFFVPIPSFKHSPEIEISMTRNVYKHCLLYCYERNDIRKLETSDFIDNREFMIGKSKDKYNVLVLRDVFNWLASILLRPGKRYSIKLNQRPKYNISGIKDWTEHAAIIPKKNYIHARRLIEYWKIYAEEFLGKTNYLKEKKIYILSNRWFADKAYREKIASLFGLINSDFSLDFVGSKSSFDGKKYRRGGALEMKILERWKTFKDNVVYHEILDICPEVKNLSYEIFGREIGEGL